MRALSVCCVLLTVLVVAEQVQGDGQFVKLCGREFIRAVIYTCGGSRWRRFLVGNPQDMAERENFFAFHGADTKESGPLPTDQKMTSQVGYEDLQQTGSLEELWGSQKNTVQERRDLNELLTTACCRTGCKKKDLNSLC
ncbi:PREDICTED: insulin-like peptide INSL5 [Nanorana parkeri]|uniref:insulin-like peptide INSL5 n=1 Tax=Nanorana parkeri TaxID=125878 RepID=UPI0008546D1F|nr:PREDICTED: insulin-like peptide INSL5 [Nanorana parkeri]